MQQYLVHILQNLSQGQLIAIGFTLMFLIVFFAMLMSESDIKKLKE